MSACPRCGSRSIHVKFHWLTVFVYPVAQQKRVKCPRCGYQGWMGHTERLESKRGRHEYTLHRQDDRHDLADRAEPSGVAADQLLPPVEAQFTADSTEDRGDPDLSSIDFPARTALPIDPSVRLSRANPTPDPPVGEGHRASKRHHRRHSHRHGESHHRGRRSGSDKRVILLVVFVVACITAVIILARACGPEPQPQQPLASRFITGTGPQPGTSAADTPCGTSGAACPGAAPAVPGVYS